MISKSAFAKLKAKEARARGALCKETPVREEWYAIARSWNEVGLEHEELESRRTATNGGGPETAPGQPGIAAE